MIHILPFSIIRLICTIAVFYVLMVFVIMGVIFTIFDNVSLYTSLSVAFSGSTILNLILIFGVYYGWRWVWSKFPPLNNLIFPDLNGSWKMKIHWQSPDAHGATDAMAHIKQDFIRISMEVNAKNSDSETLIALPKKHPESGKPILYYVFRVVPKRIEGKCSESYEGAAILSFDSDTNELRGNYFTSRKYVGYFHLSR